MVISHTYKNSFVGSKRFRNVSETMELEKWKRNSFASKEAVKMTIAEVFRAFEAIHALTFRLRNENESSLRIMTTDDCDRLVPDKLKTHRSKSIMHRDFISSQKKGSSVTLFSHHMINW